MPRIILIGIFGLAWAPIVAVASVTATATSTLSTSTPETKEVALTFDDGPYGTSTQKVLDILQSRNVPATFFLIGHNVEEYPALTKEIVQDGEVIGNHTYDHPKNLTKMSLKQVTQELAKTDAVIASTTGIHTKLFRPPYGSLTKRLRKRIESKGYTIVLWNVDPKDWDDASSTSEMIVQNILDNLQPHMTIVLHDGRDTHVGYSRNNLIAALPTIIDNLKKLGYVFVTVHPESNFASSSVRKAL